MHLSVALHGSTAQTMRTIEKLLPLLPAKGKIEVFVRIGPHQSSHLSSSTNHSTSFAKSQSSKRVTDPPM